MLARLGIVLYWVSCLEVLAIVGFGLLVLSTYGHRQGDLGAYIIFLGVVITSIVWGWGGRVAPSWLERSGDRIKKRRNSGSTTLSTWGRSVEFGSKIGSKNFKADNRF